MKYKLVTFIYNIYICTNKKYIHTYIYIYVTYINKFPFTNANLLSHLDVFPLKVVFKIKNLTINISETLREQLQLIPEKNKSNDQTPTLGTLITQ